MKTRVFSAIVLLAIFVPALVIGNLPFALMMLVISWFGLSELFKVRKSKKELPILVELFAYILVGFLTLNNYKEAVLTFEMNYQLMALLIFAFLSPLVFINDSKKYNINDALYTVGSTIFIGLSMNLIILIRNFSLAHVIYIFLITIITDTFALITGMCVGRHKLAPQISPKKTWEGLIGGTFWGALVATVFFNTVVNPSVSLGVVMVVSVILSLIGQLGDLVFSSIKRYYNQKDFSNLIPGHGGILDRLDSIIFAILGLLLFIGIL